MICACADDRFDALAAALASLAEQSLPPAETIVVIDHNPALAERVRERWPQILVATNDETRGVSTTRNVGVAASTGAIVAFLDDDAVASPDWIERMLAVYERPEVMAAGGAIEPLWESRPPRWFPVEFGWVVGCGYRGLPEELSSVRNVIGTNMSFRRDVFDGIDGFDHAIGRVGRLPVGCDETELCVRALQRWPERTIVYDPAMRVGHRVPQRRTKLSYFVARCYGEGRSKALIGERVGRRASLSTELRYTTHVLPSGVARGLRDAASGDASGAARSGAIVAGLAVTSAGFAMAWVRAIPARLRGRF